MVHTNNPTHNITNNTPASTTSSRWILNKSIVVGEDTEDKKKQRNTSAWTEVVSKHHKRHGNANDPFAGMKSSVDYEQEIERLKQLVPKVPSSNTDNTTKKNSSSRSTTPTHSHRHSHSHSHSSSYSSHHSVSSVNSSTSGSNKQALHEISRSNSPDTTHSSDSDISLPEPPSTFVITEQEKVRFLAFVRSWTGDWKGSYHHEQEGDDIAVNNGSSLWAQQTPWSVGTGGIRHHQQKKNNHNPLVISMPNNNNNTITAIAAVNPHPSGAPQFDLYWQTSTVQKQPSTTNSSYYTNFQPLNNNSRYYHPNHHPQQQQPSVIGMGRTISRGKNNPYLL